MTGDAINNGNTEQIPKNSNAWFLEQAEPAKA